MHGGFGGKWIAMALIAAAGGGHCLSAEECCYEEGEQSEVTAQGSHAHLHFSSHDIDIYDQTPDTVYQDADWPSRIEEYSDYLSR